MRFEFDPDKSREVKRKHGVSLEDQTYLVDRKNDVPEQFRVIGWSRGRLCSVIFQIRRDSQGEYSHLVRAWKATQQEQQSYAENA